MGIAFASFFGVLVHVTGSGDGKRSAPVALTFLWLSPKIVRRYFKVRWWKLCFLPYRQRHSHWPMRCCRQGGLGGLANFSNDEKRPRLRREFYLNRTVTLADKARKEQIARDQIVFAFRTPLTSYKLVTGRDILTKTNIHFL